jgi:hypothetical protein
MTTLSEIHWTRKDESIVYTLNQEDYETLVRAVAHEGKPYDGVAWVLIQRFCWVWPTYGDLETFVRAYAQPINPRWFPNGDKHLAYMKRNRQRRPRRAADELRRAKRRVEYAKQPIQDIDSKFVDVVENIMLGNTPTPVTKAVHYSASFARSGATGYQGYIDASQYAKRRRIGPVVNAGVGYNRGVNWFFAAGGSHRVDMNITIVPSVPTVPPPSQDIAALPEPCDGDENS